MRAEFGMVVLASAQLLGFATDGRAQAVYSGGVPYAYRAYAGSAPVASAPNRQVYAFKDEPVMSINRSYLGYSNFVYIGPDPPAPGYVSGYRAPAYRAPAYRAPAYVGSPAPVRRGFRLFGRRNAYPY